MRVRGYASIVQPDPTAPTIAERAVTVARWIAELARALIRGVAILAATSAAAVVFAWTVWVVHARPSGSNDWIARAVVLALALVPPAVLVVFVRGLEELSRLPRRLRQYPPDVRAHLAELRGRAGEVPERARGRRRVGAVTAVARLARLVFGSRDVLSPMSVVPAVLEPGLLVAALVAAALALIEIPAALIAILVVLIA